MACFKPALWQNVVPELYRKFERGCGASMCRFREAVFVALVLDMRIVVAFACFLPNLRLLR